MAVEEYTIRDRRPRAYGGPAWQLDTDLLDVNQLRRADPTGPAARLDALLHDLQLPAGPVRRRARLAAAPVLRGAGRARVGWWRASRPGRDGQAIPFDLEDLYSPFWGLDRYERPGPTITVYELPPR